MLIKFMQGTWPAHPFFIEDAIRHHSVCFQSGRKKLMSIGSFFFFSEWEVYEMAPSVFSRFFRHQTENNWWRNEIYCKTINMLSKWKELIRFRQCTHRQYLNSILLTKSIFHIVLVLYCFIELITPSFLTNSADERANITEFREYD